MKNLHLLLPVCILFLLTSCDKAPYEALAINHTDQPKELSPYKIKEKGLDHAYWYAGKAEVSKYELVQNRYREVHDGEAVMIFVTEDFLTDKQVKNDNYVNKNSIPIIKTNLLRRFTTGLYDYSIMTSVFTRADGSRTEKVTLGAQDWCGHSFVQLNYQNGKYHGQIRSYFESEGDQNFKFQADLLEDELLNLIRINPSLVKEGKYKILPSLNYLRLSHEKMQGHTATISKKFAGDSATLEVNYPSLNRTVTINYQNSSPYKIKSFEEIYPSAFDKQLRKSVAIKKEEIHEAYWNLNRASDKSKRQDLGVTGFD